MEEEPPSSSSRPPLPRPPPADIVSSSIPPVSSPLTYIVQVPKDHIYRIPPPENAHRAEQYNAEFSAQRRQRSPCLKFLLHLLCIAITIAIPLFIASLIFYIIVRPAKPAFHIHHLTPYEYSSSPTVYKIAMQVKNPSFRMGYSIQKGGGGGASLDYRGKNVAKGESPHFYLEAKETRMFNVSLRAGKGAGESLKVSKKAVELRLAMEMPVRVAVGGLKLWEMKMNVGCDVKVKNLGKEMVMMSQECRAKVK